MTEHYSWNDRVHFRKIADALSKMTGWTTNWLSARVGRLMWDRPARAGSVGSGHTKVVGSNRGDWLLRVRAGSVPRHGDRLSRERVGSVPRGRPRRAIGRAGERLVRSADRLVGLADGPMSLSPRVMNSFWYWLLMDCCCIYVYLLALDFDRSTGQSASPRPLLLRTQ
jgi:hypothetical protein